MALTPGTRLGAYEVIAQIGVGGMGEVYRGRDTKLNRDVALKILPEAFTLDGDRIARFRREAQVLASLNHPNIAAIYGFEDSGSKHALVLELVEGPTLADRLAKGPIPLDEALPIARQIAEALEAAHEQGIIHRDLKPANIKVRDDGTVKVLDFGLAKALEPASAIRLSLTNSPTITTPAMMTGVGTLLGTAAYMSPEQAKGRPADRRSDIWAFGCVLFEMLTGTRAFDGEDVSDTLATVLKGEPNWAVLSSLVPSRIRQLLRRCLRRDSSARLQAIGEARIVIGDVLGGEPDDITASQTAGTRDGFPVWHRTVAVAAGAVVMAALGAGVAATFVMMRGRPVAPAVVTRFPIVLTEGLTFVNNARNQLAISPDGTMIALEANRQLYFRAMGDAELRLVAGTSQNAGSPFFSPDGRWLGYLARSDGTIRKVAITGGAAVTITHAISAERGIGSFGPVWNSDGYIYVGQPGSVVRVSSNGGKLETIVKLKDNEAAHRPQLLPDGDTLIFTLADVGVAGGADRWDKGQIVAHSLKTGKQKVLIEGGSDGRYLPTGHLVYALGNTVLAVPFDVKTLQVGGPVPVIEGVRRSTSAGGGGADAQMAVAENGSMVYVPGGQDALMQLTLTLVDQSGVRKPLSAPAGPYAAPRISPDGRRFAVYKDDGKDTSVWIGELNDATPIRKLTFEGHNQDAAWLDSQRVVFLSDRDAGSFGIFRQRVDGGPAERILDGADQSLRLRLLPESWLPDGKTLLLSNRASGFSGGIFSLTVGGGEKPQLLVHPPATNPTLSPDGRWLAYSSTETGPNQIFVQPFPPTGEKHQVTTEGLPSYAPVWSRDGRRLFFERSVREARRQLMAVDVRTASGFTFGKAIQLPTPPLPAAGPRPYDVTPDGKTFLMILPKGEVTSDKSLLDQINVTLNWTEELKQRVPTE